MNRLTTRALGAVALAAMAVFAVPAAALAAPAPPVAPDSGPTAGGTTVTLQAPAGISYTEVSAGSDHTVALGSDGSTYAWGQNASGQLGDGSTASRSAPVRVSVPAGVTFTQLAAGSGGNTLAIGSDGNAYAWGNNEDGQLGDGTRTNRSTPVKVQAPAGVSFTQVSTNWYTSLALGSDGGVYAWGDNTYGKVGNGAAGPNGGDNAVPTPTRVLTPAGVTFTQVASAGRHSLALASDGTAYAWGGGWLGQLGDGAALDSALPVAVQMPAGVTFTSLSGGYWYSLAIGSDGNGYAWGDNQYGQLGDGTTAQRNAPVRIQAPTGVTFSQLSAGNGQSLGLGSDGFVYSWGANGSGLGTGTTSATAPARVQLPAASAPFTGIATGFGHSLAIGSDGETYSWGRNAAGQLGTGTTANQPLPAAVLTPPVEVTGVTFDGIAGTGLVDNGDGTVSVVTPPHAAGPVDVVLSWTLGGDARPVVTHTDGFTYVAPAVAPTITDPEDRTVETGGSATFTVEVTGTPTPSTVWEVSTDGGKTWKPVSSIPGVQVSTDGLSLTVSPATAVHDGLRVRATATNSAGSVTSESALLTVVAKAGPGGGSDGGANAGGGSTADGGSTAGGNGSGSGSSAKPGAGLATTGAGTSWATAALGALLLAGAAAVGLRALTRRSAT